MLKNILNQLQQISNSGQRSLVVFDLDSTLFDVSPRLERILLDFAMIPFNQRRFPQHIPALLKIKTLRQDWGIVGALQRAGLDSVDSEFQEAILSYWKNSFFSNHYLQFDNVYEGALEFVQAVDAAGSEIAYLTGRDVDRMGVGSIENLRQWNFPLHDKAKLILKPHRSLDDAQFKTDWFIEQAKESSRKAIQAAQNQADNLNDLMEYGVLEYNCQNFSSDVLNFQRGR